MTLGILPLSNFKSLSPGFPYFLSKPMNAMNVYLDGLLEGPSGLTDVSRRGPILGRDKMVLEPGLKCPRIVYMPRQVESCSLV